MGNVNAYRGTAYIVFPNYDLTDRRESIPDFRFEVSTSAEIVTTGKWLFGQASRDGAAGGPQNYYQTADHPLDLPSATPIQAPAWMSAFARMSAANGAIFIHSNGEPGAVSFDRAATWIQTSIIPHNNEIFWSGSYYYCMGKRSADGITWSDTPGLPATALVGMCARPGALVASYGGLTPHFRVSINEGSSWTDRPTSNTWIPSGFVTPLDSGRFLFTLDSTRGHYTDDLFQTQLNDNFALPILRTWIAESGSVFGRSVSGIDTMNRSTDGGVNYVQVLAQTSFGAGQDNIFAGADGLIAVVESHGGAPNQNTIHVSGKRNTASVSASSGRAFGRSTRA